jgi:predicted HicB family RNase H-like nuclease
MPIGALPSNESRCTYCYSAHLTKCNTIRYVTHMSKPELRRKPIMVRFEPRNYREIKIKAAMADKSVNKFLHDLILKSLKLELLEQVE